MIPPDRNSKRLAIAIGSFANDAQRDEAVLKILGLTDADEGKERRGDRPLTMKGSSVCLSCGQMEAKILLDMEGPVRQLGQARSKIDAILEPYKVPVLLAINQENTHGNPRQ